MICVAEPNCRQADPNALLLGRSCRYFPAMLGRILFFLMIIGLAACTPRGTLQSVLSPGGIVGETEVQPVFVASNRAPLAGSGIQFGPQRADNVYYSRLNISIPPVHQTGYIEWPGEDVPDPAQHFVLAGAESYRTFSALDREMARAKGGQREVIVFVHGYNVKHAEAAYRLAQIAHDFQANVPVLSFSWPSEGEARGYAYDRDSVIFSRDALETLLMDLTRDGRKVLLVGHSMGSQLVMETLRQMSIGGRGATLRRLSGVALISPDIDPDVFVRQGQRIKPFPQPFLLVTSQRDRVLGFSAWVAGKPRRLGAITSDDALGGLPVQIVDITPFTGLRAGGHDAAFTAPQAISILRKLSP